MKAIIPKALFAVLVCLALPSVALAGGNPNDGGQLPGCKPSDNTPQKCCPQIDHHMVKHDGDHENCPPVMPPEPPCAMPKGMDDHSMCCDNDNDQDDFGCPVTPPTPTPPITIVPEPPGANCTVGGIKITLNDVTPVEVFFVCNGVPGVIGPVGPQGPPGPAGPPGPQGPPGTTPTITVTQGPGPNQITITVNGVPTVITIPVGINGGCVNTRQSALLGPLPDRFTKGMKVGITSKGHTQIATVIGGSHGHSFVRVITAQLPCGVYPIVVRPSPKRPGFKPALRIWSFTGGNTLNRFWFPGLPSASGPGLNG